MIRYRIIHGRVIQWLLARRCAGGTATRTVAPLRAEHSLLLTLARGLDVPNLEHGMGANHEDEDGVAAGIRRWAGLF